MQKAEPQQNHAQSQPAQRQGGSAAFESPQGEQLAQLKAMADASPQASRLAQLAAMANNSPRMVAQRKVISAIQNSQNVTAQRQQIDSLIGETAQREEIAEPLQPKVTQRETAPAKPNNTGLPDNLKSGVESLSSMSMDNVKVHYNSSQPAQLSALAYAQGTDIHVAPGQEQHLPHEAWHVVQQAQGRVQPMMQMKDGVPVNDDKSLEHEADVMGERAVLVAEGQNTKLVPDTHGISASGTGSAMQLRKMTAGELGGGVAEDGVSGIFESSIINKGPLFTQTVEISANDANSVIGAYQENIAPIGKTARSVTNIPSQMPGGKKQPDAYTDKNIASPEGALGKKPVSLSFLSNLSTVLVATQAQLQSLGFTVGMQADTARQLLQDLFNDRVNLTNNNNIGLVDPFVMRFIFKNSNPVKGEFDWILDTQFASTAAGYIVHVQDGKNDISATIVTPEEFAEHAKEDAKKDGLEKGRDFIYSSTHEQGEESFGGRVEGLDEYSEQTDNRKVAKEKRKKTKIERGTYSKAFDAVTWMAAEGARFSPVAELGGDATPESNFYTTDPDGEGWRSVTLNWLMSNWGGAFQRGYGISKKHMARVIEVQGTQESEKPAKPRYDLDSGEIDK